MANTTVYQYIWNFFDNDLQGFTKNELELNEGIRQNFRYNAQLSIQESGYRNECGIEHWFCALSFIDENGKLRLETWSKESMATLAINKI